MLYLRTPFQKRPSRSVRFRSSSDDWSLRPQHCRTPRCKNSEKRERGKDNTRACDSATPVPSLRHLNDTYLIDLRFGETSTEKQIPPLLSQFWRHAAHFARRSTQFRDDAKTWRRPSRIVRHYESAACANAGTLKDFRNIIDRTHARVDGLEEFDPV